MKHRQPIDHRIQVIRNTGKVQELTDLLQFRNLVVSQLYLMSPIIVTKILFDGVHQSMLMKNEQGTIVGGICFYQITQHKCVSIIYFVIDSKYQVKGYGSYLMINFKQLMRDKNYETIATQADTISLNFYYKNGFVEFQKKKRKIERPPRQDEIDDNDLDQDTRQKYKKYEPWLQYIEDYYSSILLVYKIPPKIDYKAQKQILRIQQQGLINKLEQITYRNYRFKKERTKSIVKEHNREYEKQKGILFDTSKVEQIRNQLQSKANIFTSSIKYVAKLEQMALLDILSNHPTSWILKMNFVRLPDSFHSALADTVTLPFIEYNVVNDQYSTIGELCADLNKLFENLKLFLAQGSNYFQACEKLQQYIAPYITSIYQGTFNAVEYFNKKNTKHKRYQESSQNNKQKDNEMV